MATTAIRIESTRGIIRLKFMTVDEGEFLSIELYQCNTEFIPIRTPEVSVDDKTEEFYHKQLRKEASAKGQFVAEESTDPEWNPKDGIGKDK